MLPIQSKAARALLGWSQEDLAKNAQVGVATIRDFERGARSPLRAIRASLQRTFEDAGVSFDLTVGKGPGVRLKKAP